MKQILVGALLLISVCVISGTASSWYVVCVTGQKAIGVGKNGNKNQCNKCVIGEHQSGDNLPAECKKFAEYEDARAYHSKVCNCARKSATKSASAK